MHGVAYFQVEDDEWLCPKDGADAVHVISQAIVVMAKFYKENKIPLQLVKELEFSVDTDRSPEASFQKSDRSGESGCIIGG